MSITDLNSTEEIVVPAKPAVAYPLKYATKILMEGGPSSMRAYVEMTPYRRIYKDLPFPAVNADGTPKIVEGSRVPVMTIPQPIVDADGNPVLDADGNPAYTESVPVVDEQGNPVLTEGQQDTELRNTLVGEELMPSNLEGFQVVPIVVDNVLPNNVTPQGKALVEGFLTQYLQAGGDLAALVMVGLVLMIKQEGTRQGKLDAE